MKTPTLFLKPFSQLDRELQLLVWQMRTHPNVARWMTTGENISLESHLAFMERQGRDFANRNYLALDDEGPAGVASIHKIDPATGVGNLGIYRNPWRMEPGLGARILGAICEIAFDHEKLKRFDLQVARDNVRAIALYRRFGFESVDAGTLPNMIEMRLTRQSWSRGLK